VRHSIAAMVWLQIECILGIPILLFYLNYIAIRLLEHRIVVCLIVILQIADRVEDEVLNYHSSYLKHFKNYHIYYYDF
jgi:D-alanyl-lipoteichoic acid acyltransferase DltB (MBOAT superfamily)